MPPFSKPLDKLVEADLQELIRFQVRESRTLDFKRELHLNTDSEKKEFLADVVSFANASGGDLIYGVCEEQGIATEIRGIDHYDAEVLINGLESSIRNSIQPRITGIQSYLIPLATGGFVLIVHVPRSWALPHAVVAGASLRFYARNSSGKFPLDVTDLRAAFALSDSLNTQIRQFRTERIAQILAHETPVPLKSATNLIFHLVPFLAFDPMARPDLVVNTGLFREKLALWQDVSRRFRYNFDGFLAHSTLNVQQKYTGYAQFFRSGIIELVEADLLDRQEGGKPYIASRLYEKRLVEVLAQFLELYEQLHVAPPFMAMLTLTNVKGYYMSNSSSNNVGEDTEQLIHGHTIDRDMLLVPEILIEDYDASAETLLQRCFDAVWQAAGYPKALTDG